MGELAASGLILPAVVLALAGFAVPRLLARLLPEGVKPLLLNAFLSTVLLWLASALFFLLLYRWQGAAPELLTQAGLVPLMLHFGRLGLLSALIWLPVMILSVAGLPSRWRHETW